MDTALRMPANNFATCGRKHFCPKLFVMMCLTLEPLRCCATHGAADRGDGCWRHNILTRRLQGVRSIASARSHAMFLLVKTIHEAREIRTPNLLIWSQTRCHCAIAPLGTMVALSDKLSSWWKRSLANPHPPPPSHKKTCAKKPSRKRENRVTQT